MGRVHIAALILDEGNISEIARHAVSAREIEQVVFNRHITAPNPRGEAGGILLIGQTNAGRVLTIPLEPTEDAGTWRPATAFHASRHQLTLFRRHAK